MSELGLLWRLVVGLVKLIGWILRATVRLITRGLGELERLGDEELRRRRGELPPAKLPTTATSRPPRRAAPAPALDDLIARTAIVGLDAPRLHGELPVRSEAADGGLGPVDRQALVEAVLLGELLGPPRSRSLNRR